MAEDDVASSNTIFERHDFTSLYANNVRFERSAWDLKLLFGELDQSLGSEIHVEQHTGMCVSWLQAKIMAYYLEVNLLLHEAENGPISIPKSLIPKSFNSDDPQFQNESSGELGERLSDLRTRFFGGA